MDHIIILVISQIIHIAISDKTKFFKVFIILKQTMDALIFLNVHHCLSCPYIFMHQESTPGVGPFLMEYQRVIFFFFCMQSLDNPCDQFFD